MITMQAFINKHRIRISVEYADANPNMGRQDMNHFKVTLRRLGRQLSIPFSQGYGISGEPDAKSVLNCLASDASSLENAGNFESWAGEYGYDTDSRKAEKLYRAVEQQTAKLQRFLEPDQYQELLYQTETE